GSLTWLRRPRLASPKSTTEVEACHPLVWWNEQAYRRFLPAPTGSAAALVLSHHPLRLAVRVSLGDRPALVVETATARQGELELGPAVLEVDRERYEREGLLCDL